MGNGHDLPGLGSVGAPGVAAKVDDVVEAYEDATDNQFCRMNAQENIWQFMRQNWLSSRIFIGFDNIVDLCCDAWNRLTDQPWKIMSIAHRQWTFIGQAL